MSEFTTYTHLQRPELESLLSTFGQVWPEFTFYDEIARTYMLCWLLRISVPNFVAMELLDSLTLHLFIGQMARELFTLLLTALF